MLVKSPDCNSYDDCRMETVIVRFSLKLVRPLFMILLGLAAMSGSVLQAQQIPTVVVSDPPLDKTYPPRLVVVTIPSHGVDMDGTFYLAAGAGSHGTVLLLHGLPGYESNGDLAQSIRRAGWNVLLFNYRGTWGTLGVFSQSSAIEDVAEAVHFLRDPANASKYRIDTQSLVMIGHSLGAFLAGYEGANDPNIRAVAMISAVNLGRLNADPQGREARLKRWETQLHPVRGATASSLFEEAARHAKDWDYVQWADALRGRRVLLVAADDQNQTDMEALATAIRQKGSVTLEHTTVETDHSFSDHRIALQTIVIKWLETLKDALSEKR
jgi:pimeloyl-ACP methyl ester carboxylesterase